MEVSLGYSMWLAVEEGHDLLDEGQPFGNAVEGSLNHLQQVLAKYEHQQIFLAFAIEVERAEADISRLDNLLTGGLRETLANKQLPCLSDDALPLHAFVAFSQTGPSRLPG